MKCYGQVMEKERDYNNIGFDLPKEYFRKKKNDNEVDVCFTPEESKPPYY